MTDLSWLSMQPPPDSAPRPAAQSTFRWATVVGTVPLQIRLDGETVPLPESPQTLVGGLSVGRRVWVQLHGRMAVVVGAASDDTGWVDVTILPGYAARSSVYRPQVRRVNGMVHFRGQMASTGITGTSADPILQLPAGFWPEQEARWIGGQTNSWPNSYGGWISSGDGQLWMQKPQGPPTVHWAIIVAPWQPA